MNKLVTHQNCVIVKDDLVVGKLPKVKENDVILYNKKITEKPLSSFKNSDKNALKEIDKIIGQWSYGLGINIDAHDIMLLNDFIREHFGTLNIFDLKVCVKLVVSNSDEFKYETDHYGKLTMNYVSKVLKAYQLYRGVCLFNVREGIEKVKLLNAPKITDKERLINFKNLLINATEIVYKKEFYQDAGESIYNFIKYNKLMPIVKPNIDNKLIEEAMEYGKKAYDSAKKTSVMQSIIKDVSFSKLKKEDIIKKEARLYVVNKWLQKVNMQQFIKDLKIEMLQY